MANALKNAKSHVSTKLMALRDSCDAAIEAYTQLVGRCVFEAKQREGQGAGVDAYLQMAAEIESFQKKIKREMDILSAGIKGQ